MTNPPPPGSSAPPPPPPPGEWPPHAPPAQTPLATGGTPPAPPPISPYQYPAAAPYLPAYPTTPPTQPDGKLIAAGVLTLITGSFIALTGVVLVGLLAELARWDEGGVFDAAWILVVVFMVLATMFVAPAIGSIRGTRWGRIWLLIVNLLALAVFVWTLIAEPYDAVDSTVPIAWFAVPSALALFAKPWR